MLTLFLRLFLSSIFAIFAATILYASLIQEHIQQIERQQIRKVVLPIYYLLERDILQAKQPDINAILEKYQQEFPFFIRLMPLSQIDQDKRLQLLRHREYIQVVTHIFNEDEITLYYLWPNQQVLELTLDEKFVDRGGWLFWYMVVFITGSLAATVMWFSFSMTRHTYHLAKITKLLGEGNFDVTANEKTPAPINHMARSLNAMAYQLKTLIQEQDAMTMAVSHELKNPINNLRFALDMTRSIHDMHTMHQHIQDMDEDLDSLEELTHELISFSQLSKATTSKLEFVKPNPLLESDCERFAKLNPALNIQIECTEDLSLMVDPKLLRRALNNLIVNAQKYAKSQLLVRAYQRGTSVFFEVHDDGIGVPEQHRSSIFMPFARVDDSRSRQSGGHGLGLSIVERIVINHGGNVSVGDSPLGGALFTIELPTHGKQASRAHKPKSQNNGHEPCS
ncbi:sensor histidine kinase [Agarivorans sp. QJM3NY_25]|uniref:sensor histidine kinase n=1 Tax=Agarivorans sp. QJM3NY_25 TaxID=3421430 RepID=UPI003D7C832E